MAVCSICVHEKHKEIDLALLEMKAPVKMLADKYGLKRWVLKEHRRKHLPWRNPKTKPAETITEKMAELSLEMKRLQFLAELDVNVTKALAVVRQRQSLLELEMRMGHVVSSHRKLLPAKPIDGDESYRVEFVNGQAVGVKA